MEVRKAERALEEARYHLEIAQKAKSSLQKELDTFRGHAQKYLADASKAVDGEKNSCLKKTKS